LVVYLEPQLPQDVAEQLAQGEAGPIATGCMPGAAAAKSIGTATVRLLFTPAQTGHSVELSRALILRRFLNRFAQSGQIYS
jgi:hypothetical protein